jgi:hypothetical protein
MLATRKTHSGIPEGTVATMRGKSVVAKEGESVWSLLSKLKDDRHG